MSGYPFKHDKGSLVYKKEKYKFRFRGVPAAEIEIIDVPGEYTSFSFKIEKNARFWPDLPSHFSKVSTGINDLKKIVK
ncbi:hypothetical protein OOZ25_14675 [Bacillus subtilis]|uniref:hypothetical protein n=1 Tax=Bacillus subtilis TaxID=1423 RepID=UPI0025524247|nr:hypothetical protein [Bacillus subtilis]MDL2030544.1 hypothetical protein [Bacillus subtilis]